MTNNNKKNNSRMILIFNFFKPINLNSQKSGLHLHAFIINIKTILYFLYLRQSSSCSWVTQMNFLLTRNNQLTNMAKRILFLMYIWKHPAATFCCRTVHYIYMFKYIFISKILALVKFYFKNRDINCTCQYQINKSQYIQGSLTKGTDW